MEEQLRRLPAEVQRLREELDVKEQEIENYKQLLATLQRENLMLKKRLSGESFHWACLFLLR